jgi:hypothetical protein
MGATMKGDPWTKMCQRLWMLRRPLWELGGVWTPLSVWAALQTIFGSQDDVLGNDIPVDAQDMRVRTP